MSFNREDKTSTHLLLKAIKVVVRDVSNLTAVHTVQVWRPLIKEFRTDQCLQSDENQIQCFSSEGCLYGHELLFFPYARRFPRKRCNERHLLKDQGIVGKALATNQPWFSTGVSSIPDTDCTKYEFFMPGIRTAIAIPLLVANTCGIPEKYVFEFFLPFCYFDLEQQKEKIDDLIATLRRKVEMINEKGNNFPPFQFVLQPINLVGQSGASDLLFSKENPREASDERFLPEPAKVSDGTSPGPVISMAVTNKERHSTGEIISDVPDVSLKEAEKRVIESFPHDVVFGMENPSKTSDGILSPERSYRSWSPEPSYRSLSSELSYQSFSPGLSYGSLSPELSYRSSSPDLIYGSLSSQLRYQSLLPELSYGMSSPEPSYPNANCPKTTPRTEPAEVCGQGRFLSLAVGGTSEERDAAKGTGGKTTGSTGSKRDWAWQHCSPIEGNSNGVKCSFCGVEIKGGGITRFKSHLSNSDPSKNVKKCKKVPSHVKVEIEKRMKRE